MAISFFPDVLGPGFEQAKLELEPDSCSPRSATLVRYLPNKDPKAGLPDRVIPGNLVSGGGVDEGTRVVLPPQASPQQDDELRYAFPQLNPRGHKCQPVTEPLSESEQGDKALLEDFLQAELRGRTLKLSEQWTKISVKKPRFILIYIHGWNDYFYQTHLARMMSHLGAAFYALDLHRYGRNTPDFTGRIPVNSYTDDFLDYDTEIQWAVKCAREDHPDSPVLMMGHSNGGNVVAGWAGRHHRDIDGLLFNSPWLVHDVSNVPAGEMVREFISDHARGLRFPIPQLSVTTYQNSISGYRSIGSPMPRRLIPFQNDPSVRGWQSNPKWRILPGAPILAGWLSAVFRNQKLIAQHSDFGELPVLCLTGNHQVDTFYDPEIRQVDRIFQQKLHREGRSVFQRRLSYLQHEIVDVTRKALGEWNISAEETPSFTALLDWTEGARHRDTVLNGKLIEQRAKKVFPKGTVIKQVSGLHDLTLSQPLERANYFAEISAWIHSQGF